jgi:pilus assembly protein TadC
MEFNRLSIFILKTLLLINIGIILIALLQKREEFYDNNIFFLLVLNLSLFLFSVNKKRKKGLIIIVLLQYFYLTILIIELTVSGFIYLQSINYPIYLFFRFDRSEKLGDFLILIPILFLLVNFVFNHFLLIRLKNNPIKKS